ncbi:hypothetical protein OEA41_001684 [Lepraria neglecta]|uniref:AAA+ ATPase domain-containing protein n=1 Tax=Lepraria neglecta TaxID=209136 RepID=A0AAE0DP91_9LECA|nr:hypothetical protein OEA41_001684 [Lepraria neglecta]
MGPSGSGKTTLLNFLAHRGFGDKLEASDTIKVNGSKCVTEMKFQEISSFVEQGDALIGSLTVRETLDFAARLSLDRFQAMNAHDVLILFLDEPTNGLDFTASYEVIKYLKSALKKHKLIVIASIHQPSFQTFDLFDNILLLAGGQTCYNGPVSSIQPYFEGIGSPMPGAAGSYFVQHRPSVPLYMNPAEFLLDLTSSDFSQDEADAKVRLQKLHSDWQESFKAKAINESVANTEHDNDSVFAED